MAFSQPVKFENSTRGFSQLLRWVRKRASASLPVAFVMEATGIYYEPLAYHLHKLRQIVSILLPNKVKHFGKSLNIKSKTDNIDARIIGQLGTERQLTPWQPPSPVFKALRELTRHYTDLKRERTVLSNRLDALLSAQEPPAFVIRSHKEMIKKFENEIAKCEAQIEVVLKKEEWLQEKANKLLTIKGIGLISLAIILAETQGFALMANARQLTSYAGFDVVERESGTSVKGKTRISKKGNSRIRAALYFPAMVASRYNAALRAVYQRITARKAGKKVGLVALQRKLLLLIYSMWKNNTLFQERLLTSGDQERKPLLRHKDEVFENKVGRYRDLPTLDELPSDLSSEALLRQ
ncbi:IS110 family transposase [Pontibacter harenae]|uniref:IS110 family transposase n=1 Tax=Pontibacter harenae TaxID=2894083 RepID=UPI001E43D9CA|nr:IS110 family transposase [Pontibacter harenae]MCC9169200.1 IS110 family transposase [Pontibacter harenae]